MTLGAAPGQVLRMVLADGVVPTPVLARAVAIEPEGPQREHVEQQVQQIAGQERVGGTLPRQEPVPQQGLHAQQR